ncbi:Gprotein-coupled receptor (GPCR) family protein [Acanthamoeba castellanii str. Neff]|uniref:Gprotein-coupled receptor (GPCR) family protein n=1 Tax=Acanthamoeba castellanii (strain ATCC 30010 / Neff) TaxID=1257118 RepID=L8H688_ACACF|nr:Gprotein-coupled receptor (GPCR) family protein [Acanthamoeba castellanii str. Neff]ELR20263.1 Gprotein-coupled receptor (GPCR) family protein [Acanthamoeba castellanii str. Neff]
MIVHGFYVANFCWTFCIAFNFYQMIVRRNRESESLEKWYHLFSWGIPGLCVLCTTCVLDYGDTGGACYVTSALYIFLFFFIPGLTIISLNAILFFFVIREIHETLASAPKTDKKDKKKEIRVYISIFISIEVGELGVAWHDLRRQDGLLSVFALGTLLPVPSSRSSASASADTADSSADTSSRASSRASSYVRAMDDDDDFQQEESVGGGINFGDDDL